MFDFAVVSALGLVTFAAIMLFYHHYLRRYLPTQRPRQLALGALLGAGTGLSMLHPLEMEPGFLLDSRVLLLGFAGFLGGWRGAAAGLLVAVPVRLGIGGPGVYIGSITLLLAPLLGLGWRWIEHRIQLPVPLKYLTFGVVLSFSLVTILGFPEPLRAQALREALPLLIAQNMIGAILAGWMNLGIGRIALLREQLRKRGLKDSLTGLGNRGRMEEEIEARLNASVPYERVMALISIGFDDFKYVNDTLGHQTGDALLVQISRVLTLALARQDLLVRIWGDQFAILTEAESEDAVRERAQKLVDTLHVPFDANGSTLLMTARAGLALAPEHGAQASTLLQNAEIALNESRNMGRNQITSFSAEMRAAVQRKTNLIQALRQELRTGNGLRLVLQPQFSLKQKRLIGAEALLRWHHADFGNVGPAEFIPIAEGAGLVPLLDLKVFELAAQQMVDWIQSDLNLRLSVNISVVTLQMSGIAEEILSIFARYSVPAHLFEVEITESSALEDAVEALDNCRCLQAAGLSIALDDFGTGHSSLSYLQNLPLDKLKLDRSFVSKISTENGDSNAIVLAIFALANALRLQVVAEGVETETQLAWLTAHGCDIGQGYLLGRPTEADAFYDIKMQM